MFYISNNYYSTSASEVNNDLPFLFLGFILKSDIDENIKIDKKYKPFKFKHYSKINADIYTDVYYYGIKIRNVSIINDLIQKLDKITKNNDIITLSMYKKMLMPYNLTCDECYKNFLIGSFPLDLKHLYKFIKTDFRKTIEDIYGMNTDLNIAGLHLNILTSYPDLSDKKNIQYVNDLNNF